MLHTVARHPRKHATHATHVSTSLMQTCHPRKYATHATHASTNRTPFLKLLLCDLALRLSLLTWLEQKSTRGKKYTHNYKKQCFFFYYKCDWSSISPNSFISSHCLDFFDLSFLLSFPLYTYNISVSISKKVLCLIRG